MKDQKNSDDVEQEDSSDIKRIKKRLVELTKEEGDKEIESWYVELKQDFRGEKPAEKTAQKPQEQKTARSTSPAQKAPEAAGHEAKPAQPVPTQRAEGKVTGQKPVAEEAGSVPREGKPPKQEAPAFKPRKMEDEISDTAKKGDNMIEERDELEHDATEKADEPGEKAEETEKPQSTAPKPEGVVVPEAAAAKAAAKPAARPQEDDEDDEAGIGIKELKSQMAGDMMKTDIDRLMEFIRERKSVKMAEAAKTLKVSETKIEEWGAILEKSGMITMHYPPIGKPTLMFGKVVKMTRRAAKKLAEQAD